jgi:hypothetical protein
MHTLLKISFPLALALSLAPGPAARAQFDCPDEPEINEHSFLFTTIEELNLDYALQWSDSAAGLFLYPMDAVILHMEMDGQLRDVFVFSDAGMNRLTIFVCTPGEGQEREILSVTAYDGADCDGLKAPSGITTNAIGRAFDPESDLIYVADRGNDRILRLSLTVESAEICQLGYYDYFGREVLEYPVDIAVSAYEGGGMGPRAPNYTDFYVVDWGHEPNQGELLRFDANGGLEYQTLYFYYPHTDRRISEMDTPVSVACWPDTIPGHTIIYIADAANNILYLMSSNTDDRPEFRFLVQLEQAPGFWDPGGIAIDGYGRVYIANRAAGYVEAYGPHLCWPYPDFGSPEIRGITLDSPLGVVTDTYYGFCEMLVIERYWRQTGLRTFVVENGYSALGQQRGFEREKIVKPAGQTVPVLPLVFALREAYPNPFNSKCRIGFSLPIPSRVVIDVYDVLGRKVAKLMDSDLPAGEHSITFDGADLASGTYYYKMTAGKFIQTKSVVYLK